MILKHHLLTFVLCCCASVLFAQEIKLAPLFQDHMVLQRNSETPVWGWAKKGSKVKVTGSWNKQSKTAIADKDGRWQVSLSTPEAGGPYEVTIKGSETIQLEDVLIGEVWICSGQSNMQMPMNGYNGEPIEGGLQDIVESRNNNLRLFHIPRVKSDVPQTSCEGTWKLAGPASVTEFSAVGYYFSQLIQETIDIPVGMIHTSWGGTPIQAWMDQTCLNTNYPKLPRPGDKAGHHQPHVLYNAMIHPLVPFAVKGFLWYQGETNIAQAEIYDDMMETMIERWRELFPEEMESFYFAQIAPYKYKEGDESFKLREAQRQVIDKVPGTGMAVLTDVGNYNSIHPPKKKEVAQRLAYWALNKDYGFDCIPCRGPEYKSHEVKEGKMIVTFDYAPQGLTCYDQAVTGFYIAGVDKVFHPAKVQVGRRNVVLSSEKVANPVAIRYGWSNYFEGHLYNSFGLPASSFRTDNWEKEQVSVVD